MTHLTIGVSSCLAGLPVRYDGRDKRDVFVTQTLASAARLVLVCPEVELGLGTPRESLQLVQAGVGLRMITAGGRDLTGEMAAFARARVERLAVEDLDGYVLKSRSPSCGLGDAAVRVCAAGGLEGGAPGHAATADGLFAAALVRRWPHLPVTTERAVADADARARFLDCAAAYHELKAFFRTRWTAGTLSEFHRARGAMLVGDAEPEAGRIGRLLAESANRTPADLELAYVGAVMAALRDRPASGSSSRADSDDAG